MTKKGIIVLLITVMLFSLCACSSDGVDKRSELKEYLYGDDMKELAQLEISFLSSYGSVSAANYTDDLTMYNEFVTVTRDAASQLSQKAIRIEANIKNKELRDVHKKYVAYSDAMLQVVTKMITALETTDYNMAADANSILLEGNESIIEYRNELEELAKAYDVEFKFGEMAWSDDFG